MSAFIVNDYHINALVSFAVRQGTSFYWKGKWQKIDHDSAQRFAAELYSENVRSVNARYKERTRRQGFVFTRVRTDHLEPSDIISACDCLRYQSSETTNYERTLARKITNAIREEAINMLIDGNGCWELREPETPAKLIRAASALGVLEVVHVC